MFNKIDDICPSNQNMEKRSKKIDTITTVFHFLPKIEKSKIQYTKYQFSVFPFLI